jgi:FAD/FMN-containing dehydrogenase
VIQDVDIPVERAAEFLDFFVREIGIVPVWICPIRAYDARAEFALYRYDPMKTYVNFGFWDVVRDHEERPAGYYNRKVERKVSELGGIKSLYSESYYAEDEFWKIYDKAAYEGLKARYDPRGRFKNLYQKCVLRH